MRNIFAAAVLLFCLTTAQESAYSTQLAGSFHLDGGTVVASLGEIDSPQPSDEHETISPAAGDTGVQSPAAPAAQTPPASSAQTPSAPAANSASKAGPLPSASEAGTAPQVSLDDLCSALLTSAQDNNLPVAFFANLIWQESRLHDDAVSPKGALGIAQFMPKVALASGLENPFDPLQALSASARLLHELRDQFGNLGFVAAAYNAGAKRVSEWLERGRTLPRETRGYVMDVTGRSVEQWQKAPPADDALQFARRLPCRDFPAFAKLEQAQLQEAKLERQQAQQAHAQVQAQVQAQAHEPPKPKVEHEAKLAEKMRPRETVKTALLHKQERVAEIAHPPRPARHEQERVAARKPIRPPQHEAVRVAASRLIRPPRRAEVHLVAERERLRERHEAKQRLRRIPEERRRRA